MNLTSSRSIRRPLSVCSEDSWGRLVCISCPFSHMSNGLAGCGALWCRCLLLDTLHQLALTIVYGQLNTAHHFQNGINLPCPKTFWISCIQTTVHMCSGPCYQHSGTGRCSCSICCRSIKQSRLIARTQNSNWTTLENVPHLIWIWAAWDAQASTEPLQLFSTGAPLPGGQLSHRAFARLHTGPFLLGAVAF